MKFEVGDLVMDTYPQWDGHNEDFGIIISFHEFPNSEEKYHVAWTDVQTGTMFYLWETDKSIKLFTRKEYDKLQSIQSRRSSTEARNTGRSVSS